MDQVCPLADSPKVQDAIATKATDTIEKRVSPLRRRD
jgi:hypothetical protein